MIYILEGNECCFKSTIASKLSDRTSYKIIKGSSFELSKSSNEELFSYFNTILDSSNIIVDRFIYSNLVYAALYKDYSILNREQVINLQNKMNINNVTAIYLTAPDEVIKERLRIRGDDYVVEDMITSINKKYEAVIGEAKKDIEMLAFDTSKFESDEIVEAILHKN